MVKINKILFPVDLGEPVDDLIPYALSLAQKFGAVLYVLTVIPDMASVASLYAPKSNIATLQGDIHSAAKKRFDSLMHHFKDLPKVAPLILTGGPAEQIIATAKKEGVDLIVMGTHGRRGLEKSTFGSVCDKVIKSAVCPVLSIPPTNA